MRARAAGMLTMLLVLHRAAAGQVARGTVVDASQAPVAGAPVMLMDAASSVRARAVTDDAGGFRLRAPKGGAYWVEVAAVGYEFVQTEPFVLAQGDSVIVEVETSPRATMLEGVTVVARDPQKANYARFLEHQRFGHGRVRGPEDIERFPVLDARSALRTMTTGLTFNGRNAVPTLRSRGRTCTPTVIIDGVAGVGTIESVPASQIRALEIHADPGMVPSDFLTMARGCGVIAIWTQYGVGDPAPVPATNEPRRIRTGARARTDNERIARDELDRGSFTNALDAIRSLRPRWLQTRPGTFPAAERCAAVAPAGRSACTSGMAGPGEVQVYVDGQKLGGVGALGGYPLAGVVYLQYYSPTDASARWGLDHGQGAIYLSTRP